MKHLLLTGTLLLFAIAAFSGNPPAYSIQKGNTPNELIISFERYSVKQYDDLVLALGSVEGVQLVGACEKWNVFFLTYDQDVYATTETAFDAVMMKTRNYQPLIKIGSSIADVKNNCDN